MQQEEPNDAFNWKNKLDALEGLPGEAPFQKDRAWEKLYTRLDRGNGKRFPAYWIAAASVLIVIFSCWFLLTKDTNQANKIPPSNEVVYAPAKQNTETLKAIEPVQHVTRETAHEKSKVMSAEKAVKQDPGVKPIHAVQIVQPGLSTSLPLPGSIVPDKMHDTMLLAATITEKKKLRVVHINELSNQMPVRNPADPHKKPFSETEHVYRGFAFSRNASDEILKIKLSPSN